MTKYSKHVSHEFSGLYYAFTLTSTLKPRCFSLGLSESKLVAHIVTGVPGLTGYAGITSWEERLYLGVF